MSTIKTRPGSRLRAFAVLQAVLLAVLVAPLPAAAVTPTVISSPIVTSTSPSALGGGATGQTVVVSGTEFQNGAQVTISGGVVVSSTTFINTSNLSAVVTVPAGTATGPKNVTVTNPDTGTGSNAVFSVNATPTVTSANPSSLGQGASSQAVTIGGAGFQSGAMVSFSGGDITVEGVTFQTASSLLVTISISAAATPGARSVTVTNSDFGVGTGTNVFTVTFVQSTPFVFGAIPASLGQGATARNVAIDGSDFRPGATVSFGGGGVTVTGVTYVSDVALLATVNVAAGSSLGDKPITVTNSDGGTDATSGIFSVIAGPTVTSASPNNLNQGTSGNVVIYGTGFAGGATVTFSGSGVTASVLSVAGDGSSLTANVTVSASATAGLRDISVSNPAPYYGVGTGVGKFTVNAVASAPTVTSTNPSSLVQGSTNQNVTVYGTNFVAGATVAFSSTGVMVNSRTWNSATSITANVSISASAPVGLRNVTVTNPDTTWGTGYGVFQVVAAASPVVDYTSPDRLQQGTTNASVAIYGSNFSTGSWSSAWVSFSGSGITVSSVTRNSSTSLTAYVSIGATAATGSRNLTVTNPDGSGSYTAYQIFQVTSGLRLRFATSGYPSSTTGSLLSPQPIVELVNASGVVDTAAADQVPIRLTVSPTTSSFTCTSGVTRQLVNGVASFTGCTLPAGTYTLTAAPDLVGSSITPFTGATFTVIGTKLAFTQQPGGTNAVPGQALPTQPIVAVQSSAGAVLTAHSSGTVTLTITTGTGTTGATLSCTNSNFRAVVNGYATFAGCAVSAQGTNYTLTATYTPTVGEATIPSVASTAFSVNASSTQIALSASATIVTSGQGFTLTAQFATLGTGKALAFQRKGAADLDWVSFASVTADTAGRASTLVVPTYTAQYRASFAGGGGLVAGTSNVVSVTARFSSGIMAPTYAGTRTLTRGTTVTYAATARPLNPGNVTPTITFQIFKLVNGAWVFQTSATGPSNSSAMRSFSWTWSRSGTWYMRARINATAYNSGIFTNIARVRIP